MKSEKAKMDDESEPFGLENLGNTCFMNSALQCLARTKNLIPKLELFGSGNELVLLVKNTENDAQVTVISASPPPTEESVDEEEEKGKDDMNSKEKGDSNQELDDDHCDDLLEQEAFKIKMVIPRDSMTGKVKRCFKAITRHSDATPGSEAFNTRVFLQRLGRFYAYRPNEVHNMMAKHFRPGQQHDSHELLRTIVDMMKKDQTKAFRVAIMKHFGVAKNGEGSDPKMVELVKSLDQKVKHKTFIDELFGGELMTTQTCLTCQSCKRSHEDFLDLSLPIRVHKPTKGSQSNGVRKTFKSYSLFDEDENIVINKTVQQCLSAFTESALLTDSNAVECENCHKVNLAKVEAGADFEEIFPNAKKIIEKESSASSSGTGGLSNNNRKGGKNRDRKKKRNGKQGRKGKANHGKGEALDKDDPTPGPSNGGIALVENHFKHPSDVENTVAHANENNKEKQIKIQPDGLDDNDYVIIPSSNVKPVQTEIASGSKKGENIDEFVEIDSPHTETAMEEGQPAESLEDDITLSKPKSDEDDDDSDLPPALEGIGGSISEGEDDDNNEVTPLGLPDLPTHDKFEYFKLQSEDEFEGEGNNVSETEVEKGTTADEGFSEGENSASVDNDQQGGATNESSNSSSRNSISDPDENSKSSSTSANEGTLTVNNNIFSKLPITKCPCARRQVISRPPEFLTIHLKRFQFSLRGFTSKLTDHVEFPMILDLTPFCVTPEDEQNIEHRKDTIFDEDSQVVYSLYGIVEHSGTLNWGHYVAYIRVASQPSPSNSEDESNLEDKTLSKRPDKWFYISDSNVDEMSKGSSVRTRDPYILFYERIRGDEKRKRLAEQNSSSEMNTTYAVNGWGDSTKTDAGTGTDWLQSWTTHKSNDWDKGLDLDQPVFANVSVSVNEDEIPVNETGTSIWDNKQTTSQITSEVWDEPTTDESSSQATVIEKTDDPDPWD